MVSIVRKVKWQLLNLVISYQIVQISEPLPQVQVYAS